ncbi:MAG: sodium/solute symporter [Saprospiraceae bacterium]|nr:sodium/solute symporter [Saprospiraceae bacterium]
MPAVDATFALLDWIVLFAYGVSMLFIGWFYGRKNQTEEDYLLGGRKMNPTAIGISLFASLLSTISYLTYPGEMIKHGPLIFGGLLAFPLVYYIAGWWLIPRIMQMNVTSAYEILETKLGLRVRLFATFMFLSLRLLWMATIIYVTVDVALLSTLQFDRSYVPLIGAILTLITIVYTSMGGLKAVVFTDVVQTSIFMAGALISVAVVCYEMGSFTALFPTTWPEYWDPLRWDFDPLERTTVGNAVLVLLVWYICTTGSDQMAIQRYLATKDIHAARKSFKISIYSTILTYLLLALVGLAMITYFTNHPSFLPDTTDLTDHADILFPRFILVALPSGLSGLIIAGLLAAAMSSMSSGLNSVSAVVSEDLIKRFKSTKNLTTKDKLNQVRRLSYLTGALVLLLSLFVGSVQGNLLDVIMKVVNLFVAPLFVLFFMALFVPFATERATLMAGGISVFMAIGVAFYSFLGITVLWIMPSSLIVGIAVGILFSLGEQILGKK